MRHRVYGKHLGRNKNERTALFNNLVQTLLVHGKIQTTESKAKAIKGLVDKIVNQAKGKENRWLLQSFLTNKVLREKLIKEIAPSMKNRRSGYTSITKLGPRYGDNAMMVRMGLLIEESKSNSKNVIASKAKQSKTIKKIAASSFDKTSASSVEPLRTPRNDAMKIVKKSPRKVKK